MTTEERNALETYAAIHGRNWKSQLRDDWMNGRASETLQQLRNSPDFGPKGLADFRLSTGVKVQDSPDRRRGYISAVEEKIRFGKNPLMTVRMAKLLVKRQRESQIERDYWSGYLEGCKGKDQNP